jgi:hypothetical protein
MLDLFAGGNADTLLACMDGERKTKTDTRRGGPLLDPLLIRSPFLATLILSRFVYLCVVDVVCPCRSSDRKPMVEIVTSTRYFCPLIFLLLAEKFVGNERRDTRGSGIPVLISYESFPWSFLYASSAVREHVL